MRNSKRTFFVLCVTTAILVAPAIPGCMKGGSPDAEVAPAEKPPGAAAGIVVRAVVTVEVINRGDKLVTIKGPKGKYLTLPVEDMSLLTDLEIGEVVILTYAEAVALSIEKVK